MAKMTYEAAVKKYQPTLGLEVHVELNTATKAFDDSPQEFDAGFIEALRGYREVRQSLAQQAEATKEVIEAAKAASVKKASDATVKAGAAKAAAAKPAPATTALVSGDAVDDEEDDAAQAATAGAATATAVSGESFDLFG